MDSEEGMQCFWGRVVPAGQKVRLEALDEFYTFLNSACLGELKGQERTVLKAHVETILIDEIDENTAEPPTRKDDVVLASLIPGVCEQAALNVVFSPLNMEITLEVEGPNDVHIAGRYEAVSDDDDLEEEEEEEEEEELNERQLVKKLMELDGKEK